MNRQTGLLQMVGTDGGLMRFGPDRPLRLDSGAQLADFEIAYRTYGKLNADRSNAVLVCHALTGDQHLASEHPVTGKPGGWARTVGPGLPLDPARYFIICSNVVGGCMGTTGPSSIDLATGDVDLLPGQFRGGFVLGKLLVDLLDGEGRLPDLPFQPLFDETGEVAAAGAG